MTSCFHRFLLFIAIVFSPFFLSTSAKAESLNSAVESALSFHPSIEEAIAALNVEDQKRREQVSGYFPEVNVSGIWGRTFQDNSTSRGLSVTRGNAYSYFNEESFGVKQMLFDGLETKHRVGAARARKKSAGVSISDLRENLAYRASQSYVDVLRVRTGLKMLQEHHGKVSEYLNRIDTMVNEGAADEAELQQAKRVMVILDTMMTNFGGQIRAAEAQYQEITGHMPGSEMENPVPRLDLIPQDAADAIAYAQNSHPSILAADLQARAAEHEVKAEEAVYLPDLDGEISYLKSNKDDVIGGELVDQRAFLRMSWAFAVGGAQVARVNQKKHAYEETQARIKTLKREIERDILLAYSEYKTAWDQLENLREGEALSSKLFETYEAQFEGARVTQLQLMQAHNQVFNAGLEKMNGEYRMIAAQYALLASVGRLQESLNVVAPDSNEQSQ